MKKHEEQPFSVFMESLISVSTCFYLVLIAEMLALTIVLARDGLYGFSGYQFGLISLYMIWVLIISSMGIYALYRLFPSVSLRFMLCVCYVWTIIVLFMCSLMVEWFYFEVLWGDIWNINIERVVTDVTMGAILTGLLFRYLYLQQQLTKQEKAELHSRIQALQSRIRPHFLFNSMNIIASLIGSDPEKAEQVVEDLSELFRASLNEVGNQVPIAQELRLCRQYLNIELLRLEDRAQIQWHVDESIIDKYSIPLLTLQPLLENAIYHGIQPRIDGGKIFISVAYAHPKILITVINPLVQVQAVRRTSGNKMAINNIRLRLTSLYGNQASVTVGEEGDQFVCTLSFPARSVSESVEKNNIT